MKSQQPATPILPLPVLHFHWQDLYTYQQDPAAITGIHNTINAYLEESASLVLTPPDEEWLQLIYKLATFYLYADSKFLDALRLLQIIETHCSGISLYEIYNHMAFCYQQLLIKVCPEKDS